MLLFFFTRHGAWQFKKYGPIAPYPYPDDWKPWNSSTYSLRTAPWKIPAILLPDHLHSLHAGGSGGDQTGHQDQGLTDDTWSGLRLEREREGDKVCLAADIPPSRVSTEQAYRTLYNWGPGSVWQHSAIERFLSFLLWTTRYHNHFYKVLTRTDDKYQPCTSTMDPFSVLFLIGALILISVGLALLWHFILGP